MTEEEYERFVAALLAGEKAPLHELDRTPFFEGCLPIEEMARRGPRHPALRTDEARGPDRSAHRAAALRRRAAPAGQPGGRALLDGRVPDAAPLAGADSGSSARSPASQQAEFVRLGRSTATATSTRPSVLRQTCRRGERPTLFFAGQISGVEGYTESAATGSARGHQRRAPGRGQADADPAPGHHARARSAATSPHAATGELPADERGLRSPGFPMPQEQRGKKKDRRARAAAVALDALDAWIAACGEEAPALPMSEPASARASSAYLPGRGALPRLPARTSGASRRRDPARLCQRPAPSSAPSSTERSRGSARTRPGGHRRARGARLRGPLEPRGAGPRPRSRASSSAVRSFLRHAVRDGRDREPRPSGGADASASCRARCRGTSPWTRCSRLLDRIPATGPGRPARPGAARAALRHGLRVGELCSLRPRRRRPAAARWCGSWARAARSGSSPSAARRPRRSGRWLAASAPLRARGRAGRTRVFLNLRGGAADRPQRAPHPRSPAARGGRAPGTYLAPRAAALVRHPPAGSGRRSARDPGAARARLAVHHPALHPRRRGRADARLRPGPPARRARRGKL